MTRKHSKTDWKEIVARQGHKCARCKEPLDVRSIHIDHITELQDGGTDTIDNKQALCSKCHDIKTHEERVRRRVEYIKPKREKDMFGFDKIEEEIDNSLKFD